MATINNHTNTLKSMIRKYLCDIILIADDTPSFWDKVQYYINVIFTSSLIMTIMSGLDLWYLENKRFFILVIGALIMNTIVGVWYHKKMRTFSWEEFFVRNLKMWIILILVYYFLESLRITAGDNIAGEFFKTVVQLSTLLYPGSKALKNLYILSNKQFPPKFIMERLYNFEKTGNVKDLFPEQPKEKDED